MDYDGNLSKNLEFTMGQNTEAFASCSAQLNGEFYVMGGANFQDQISKIDGCKLQRIGDLPFTFYGGTCATYNIPYESIFMCFGNEGHSECRR